MKNYWGSGGIAPRILHLGTRWRWVISFSPRPLYPQGKSPRYSLFSYNNLTNQPTNQPANQFQGTESFLRRYTIGRNVKLTTHLHLVPRLRMRGAVPPLPQYIFMPLCVYMYIYIYNLRFFMKMFPLINHRVVKTWGSGGIVIRILIFDTRWTWVISFTPRPIYPRGKNPQ
jgi:hypothetical protein